MHIWPSANKDSNCWGQDISSSYSKSIENTRLNLSFFKTMASKENMLKINGDRVFRPEVINSRKLQKLQKPWFLCDKH